MCEKNYKIIFLRKEYSTMNLVGILKTDSISNTIRYKGKTYIISIDKPAFSEKKSKVYIVDFDSCSQLKFDEIKCAMNPNELDLILSNQIIKELTAGAISDKREKIFNMILGAIIGALISAICMFIYMNNQIEQIYKTFSITPIVGV